MTLRLLAAALIGAALLPSSGPARAQPLAEPQLSIEQRTLVRCSSVFAIVAAEQARQVPSALAYPTLAERGREYFVRTAAQLIDDEGLTREAVADLMRHDAERLQAQLGAADNRAELIDRMMQPCLLSLTASGL